MGGSISQKMTMTTTYDNEESDDCDLFDRFNLIGAVVDAFGRVLFYWGDNAIQ
jgi:hypothetical protein